MQGNLCCFLSLFSYFMFDFYKVVMCDLKACVTYIAFMCGVNARIKQVRVSLWGR